MMGRRFATSLMARAVLAVGLVAGSFPAVAQSVEDLPVKERPRPEYDPVGLRWTNVFFYPAIGLSEVYDDNVFASEDDETDDFITILSPSLAIRSDGTRGGWQAGLNGNFGFYASEHDENYSDLSASLGGRYDVLPDGTLSLDGGYARLHEDRSSPDDAKGTEPTLYRRGNLHAGYGHRFNRLGTRLDLSALDYAYDDVETASGTVDNGDRDRLETAAALRLSYDISPDYAVFTRGTLMRRRYDDDRDRNGVDRDSDGYRLDAGVAVDLTGLLALELSLGYLSRDYDDPQLSSVDGVAAGAKATWNVTRLTTVTATIDREIEETTVSGASGRLDTLGEIEVDHELLRNLILSARLGYRQSDFEGASRKDDRIDAGLSADYLLDQGLKLSASATHTRRESDAAGADFSRNVVMLRLGYGF